MLFIQTSPCAICRSSISAHIKEEENMKMEIKAGKNHIFFLN